MLKAKIIYDTSCPVCTNYMRLVKRKVPDTEVDYVAAERTASDFEYVSKDGTSYAGTKAIEMMAKDYPVIKDYMWYLPPEYRTTGLKAAYKVGNVIRKAIGVVKKGCNCGGKK